MKFGGEKTRSVLLLALVGNLESACGGDSVAEEKAAEEESEIYTPPLSRMVLGCLALHPERGTLGESFSIEEIVKKCGEIDRNAALCDTTNWIRAEAAVCIATSSGLPVGKDWSVSLEMQEYPREIHWRVGLVGGGEFRRMDVNTGEIVEIGGITLTVFGNPWPPEKD